ncbi:MAG: nucleoside triphosphate hydrolase, partial [Alteromonas sp.]
PVKGRLPELEPEQVHLAIQQAAALEQDTESGTGDFGKEVHIRTKRGVIKPRNPNQAQYVANVLNYDITFGVGPAGTGKTYLAVAAAVDALERQEIRRILLTRPAVEAGEKLGFLPGDLSQKVDPYLRPLYDALFEMLGFEKVEKLMERNVIEVAPLAYMRGRTLNDAFIILDESQNTTVEQMKMFLTRIGFNSKAVITGDITQVDLPRGARSGLRHAIEVLDNVDDISFNFFNAEDVVRHPVVARIVRAYEHYDAQQERVRKEKKEEALRLQREQADANASSNSSSNSSSAQQNSDNQ